MKQTHSCHCSCTAPQGIETECVGQAESAGENAARPVRLGCGTESRYTPTCSVLQNDRPPCRAMSTEH